MGLVHLATVAKASLCQGRLRLSLHTHSHVILLLSCGRSILYISDVTLALVNLNTGEENMKINMKGRCAKLRQRESERGTDMLRV